MPDVFSPEKRSEVMSLIRSKGNSSTEKRLLALMREAGIKGWRRHMPLRFETRQADPCDGLRPRVGRVRPDFVFRRERVAVFVDGCFWHGCPRHATQPRQNRKFWREKIARNQARDALTTQGLRRKGWRVLRIWECALTPKRRAATLRRLLSALHKP